MSGSDGFQVDPAVLMSSAQGINTAGQQLATDVGALQATVTSQNPWGSDDPGTVFGQLYVAVLGHALHALDSHVELLLTAAQGLAGWAESTTAIEQVNTDQFQQIASQL